MNTVGLCLIIKNEKKNLERLLSSVKNQVDVVYMTDTGSTDGSVKEMERLCKLYSLTLEVSHFDWVNNFSKARNFNFSQAKTDWILWMDGDDSFEGTKLREVIKNGELAGATGLLLEYKYQVDKEGNVLNRHPKLRIVKNGYYSWTHETAGEVPIHENLFPLPGVETKDMGSKDIAVRHWMDEEAMHDSMQRNIKILKELEKQEGVKPDPRTVFLLGRELFANGTPEQKEESIKHLKQFLEMGGTEGESLHACSMIAKMNESKGRFKEQLQWASKGIGYHPRHPLGYLNAGEAYRNMGRWDDAIVILEQALEREVLDMEMIAFSGYVLNRSVSVELANAYNEVGRHEDAIELIHKLQETLEDKDKQQAERSLAQITADSNKSKVTKAINVLANGLIANDNARGLEKLSTIVPPVYAHLKPALEIKRSLGLNKLWNKGSIVIYATVGIEEWDEASVEKGIGGSETAVAEMAKRWGKAGYHVTVYGDVNKRSDYGNVSYLPAPEIEWADEFDIFISWRNAGLFEKVEIKAAKKYLWLHDVPNPVEFNRDTIERIDKVIVLSDYHRGLLPDVPDEKIYVSRNGIDSDLIKSIEVKRNPKKVIYASQPIRGLEFLLDTWAVVREEVEDAELVWAYGWDNYDIMIERGVGSQEFKDKMVAKMKELGVKDLGRLGKKELYEEFKSSGIFAYPTSYPEISCIVMMEAQACGCYPISTGVAALAETQIVGDKIPLEKFQDKLIWNLKHPTSVSPDFFYKKFGWNELAIEWMNDLFYGVEWEDPAPLVSVIHITGRKGGIRMLVDSIKKQSYSNIELIVIDKLYEERADEVESELSKLTIPHLHIPDPPRDGYKYGLCHAHNAALSVCNGELLVFLQDFYDVPEDGIEKFVNLYQRYPSKLLAGVDRQYSVKNEIDKEDKLDMFKGQEIEWGEKQWESMWMKLGKGRRVSVFAREWEANWSAAPKKVLEKIGGWNVEWDKGHGWDNVDVAFRHCEMGGQIIVDESNIAKGVRHDNDWQTDEASANGQRFLSYAQAIQNTKNPNLVMKFKEPNYDKKTKKRILNFKENV